MAETAMVGHVRHRVGGGNAQPQGIQVRQGTERGTGQQSGTAVSRRGDGGSDGAAENDLGQ
ncbi:hypothetical protein D3C73_1093620 [compost metagenome]